MGKFVISTRKNGEFQFNLKANNGQVILSSEGYTTKAACNNGIESVRKNSADDGRFERKEAANDARFERKESTNGKWYFNLKSTNGQVVGSSQMYESEASRENGIQSVMNNAPDATVDDETAA